MGSGEKYRMYVGFNHVIRVFLMVFLSTLMYLRRSIKLKTYLKIIRYVTRVGEGYNLPSNVL